MKINKLRTRQWRIFPKISYANFYKLYNIKDCFKSWFCIKRFWGGKIIDIQVKHHQLSLDFRGSWLVDMFDFEKKQKR